MQTNDLRKAIQKKLLVRLGLMGLALSVALGIGSYARERDRVSEAVVDRARRSVKRFNIQIRPLLDADTIPDRDTLMREMDAFGEGAVPQREGNYVLIAIYDRLGRELMLGIDPTYADPTTLERYMTGIEHRLSGNDRGWNKIVRIAGAPFIHVAVPLETGSGEVVAHIEGVFAVSDDEIGAIRRRMLRNALAGIAVVLITTVLVYPIIASLLGRLARLTTKLLDANLETLQVLGSAIAKRDSDTDAHNFRVTVYSVKLAEAVGIKPDDIRTLIKGAFLHDVGKIGVRDNVLLKPGPLSDDEFEVMKSHVDHGLDIVKRSEWLADARSVVGGHHEKYDGSGYLRGLRGEEIPLPARVFALADVFDALTSKRPYKEPYTFDESMQILEAGRGSHFDPFLLDTFRAIARPLYEEFVGRDDDKPREVLSKIVERYFKTEVGELV